MPSGRPFTAERLQSQANGPEPDPGGTATKARALGKH